MLDFNDDLITAFDEIGQNGGSGSDYGGLAECSGGSRDVLGDEGGHTTVDDVILIETGNY